MKKFCSIILATAVAASLFAGCNQNKLTDTTTASTIATESSAAASGGETVQTTAPAETEVWEPESFEELYGDQLMNYLGHQYYFDGKAIPVEESNFYFINAFFDLSGYANMGYYPATTIGYIDLAAEYTGADYETYGDFFVKYAENSLFTSMILNARAEAKGMKLSNETLESIDAMMEELRTGKAANSGMNLDEYLQFYYGPGNDEVHFRSVLERYYLADAYSAIYCDEYEFEDSVKYVPYVRYALFYAPDTAEQAEKDKALEQANKMKDSCTKIDDLSDLAATAQEQGLVADQGDIEVPKGQMVAKFEEWAYGANRKEGELDVIYAPEYGYFVVGYLGLKERDKDTLDQIALNDLSASLKDEIANGGHDFHTDEAYGPAPAAPTPTTAPDVTPAEDGGTVTTDPTSASVPADQTTPVNKQLSTTDVLVVVFITLAAVAIAAVVIILIASAMKNGKNGGSKTSSAKSSSAPKKESKPKASSKKVEEEDDDEDDEDDDEEEEDEDDEDDDE